MLHLGYYIGYGVPIDCGKLAQILDLKPENTWQPFLETYYDHWLGALNKSLQENPVILPSSNKPLCLVEYPYSYLETIIEKNNVVIGIFAHASAGSDCESDFKQVFDFDKTDLDKKFCSTHQFMVIPDDRDF